MNLTPVTDLLREQIGIAPESLGATVLSCAVEARMRTLGLTVPEEYAARLTGDLEEFQALVGDLTVPETWFFRGGDVFVFMARHIANEVRLRQTGKRYRILSVPCSTGEEPYSLAIALVEAGVPPAGWAIEGVDLSARQIERACEGRFGEFSFRQTAPELRLRYFQPIDTRWELAPAIRSLVRFRQGNLFAPFFMAGEEPFDLVFCRNLFIYLHPAARQRALATLDRLLAPQGLLCMGHAEPLEFLDPRFVHFGPDGYFLYSRRTAQAPDQVPPVVDRPRWDPAPWPEAAALPTTAAPHSAPVDLLAQARQQADRGQLDLALATCGTILSRSGSSAQVFCLMGVLHQARQEKDEATRCFQRALYLEPAHRDSLTHLMLLCQEHGDHVQEARLRRRLDRSAQGGEP
jgi:chemotaxis protein methyltransferase WspC